MTAEPSRRRIVFLIRVLICVLIWLFIAGCTSAAQPSPAPSTTAESTTAESVPARSTPAADTPRQTITSGTTRSATARPGTTAGATTRPATTTRTTTPPATTQPTAGGPRVFVGDSVAIDAALAQRMSSTWRPGCPVPLSALSYLRMSYRGFDGKDHVGEMVVATVVARQVISVFHLLFDEKYPIRRMNLVDDFTGDDDASMAADNTSGFNCRPITGGTGFSQHSYGQAIDVDPVENPYIGGGQVLPPAGSAFVGRPDSAGVIHHGDATVAAFASIGWSWGGDWSSPRDLQHFSANGR